MVCNNNSDNNYLEFSFRSFSDKHHEILEPSNIRWNKLNFLRLSQSSTVTSRFRFVSPTICSNNPHQVCAFINDHFLDLRCSVVYFFMFWFSEEIRSWGIFFSFVLEDDARGHYYSAMIGLDARGLDAHDLDDRGLDAPDLDVPTDVAEEIQLQRLPLD